MALLSPIPKIFFGTAYSGYKLFTYTAGTTTKKTTYTDDAEGTANANPIILDSNGGANVWLTPGSLYKFTLAPSTDTDPPTNATWTVDNVSVPHQLPVVLAKTANYTTVAGDNGKLITCDATAGAFTITLLAAATAGSGHELTIKKIDTGTNAITIDGNGAETIDTLSTFTLNKILESITIVSNGTNWLIRDRVRQLRDENGNEILVGVSTASAVNEISIQNRATGSNPIISASGDDTNIGIDLQAKGTGVINIPGTSAASAEIRLFEDTDNGTNYIGIKAPAALTANTTFTEPNGDGAANTFKLTNGSGTLSWSTLTGVAATQAEQETGTSTTVPVTPGRQHFHPSAVKGWVMANTAGASVASYDVSSITDNGAGDATVNWATALSTANYCVATGYELSAGTLTMRVESKTTTTTRVVTLTVDSPANTDPTYFYAARMGDI